MLIIIIVASGVILFRPRAAETASITSYDVEATLQSLDIDVSDDSTRIYTNVTESIFACVQMVSQEEQGTIYTSIGEFEGTATTNTVVGESIMRYQLLPEISTIVYYIEVKPRLAPSNAVWSGIQSIITICQESA